MMTTVLLALALLALASLGIGLALAKRNRLPAACATLAAAFLFAHATSAARAQDAGAGSGSAIATAPAGSGSGSAVAVAPAAPPTSAGGVIDRLETDFHDGKLLDAVVLAMFGLVLLARSAPVVGPWLSQGRRATITAAVMGALATGLTTLVTKSVTLDWLEGVLMAGVMLYIHPNPSQNEQAKAAA